MALSARSRSVSEHQKSNTYSPHKHSLRGGVRTCGYKLTGSLLRVLAARMLFSTSSESSALLAALAQSLSSAVPLSGVSAWKPECQFATCQSKQARELA